MENETEATKVWNPLIVGLVTLFADYTVGAVLAAINAHRLKENGKRNLYLLIGLPYMLIFWLGGLYFVQFWFSALALIVRVGLAYWLYTDSKKLIEKKLATENLADEKLTSLLLIAAGFIGVTVLCMVLMFTFNSQ